MPINVFPSQYVSFWDNYDVKSEQSNIVGTASYQDVININNSGFLACCIIKSATASVSTLRITLDGTVIFLGDTGAVLDNGTGVCMNQNVYMLDGSALMHTFVNGSKTILNIIASLPYTTGGSNRVIILPNFLYFKNSIRVEISSGSGVTAYYNLQYLTLK